MQETRIQSLVWEDPLGWEWLPAPVFSPGEFHRQKSRAGSLEWDAQESDMTE